MCMATWENGRDFLLPPLRFNTELENTHTHKEKKRSGKNQTQQKDQKTTPLLGLRLLCNLKGE